MLNLPAPFTNYLRQTFFGRQLKKCLNTTTTWRGKLAGFNFPPNYLRQWKNSMLSGQYETETTLLFKKIIAPGMVIVDIGAHIGYFTRLFARLSGPTGKVFAFEADPENFSLLKRNTTRFPNVTLLPLAVSNRAGTIDFYHSEDKTGCHSTIPADFRQRKITVTAADLDSVLAKEAKIDLIKMDIEGGEGLALEGMKRVIGAFPKLVLVVEFNPECLIQAQVEPLAFLNTIQSLGFRLAAITANGLVPLKIDDHSNYQNFLFGSHFVNIYCAKV